GEARPGARGYSEKIDKHTLVGRGVLIDEDPDGLIISKSLQDGAREILLEERAVAGEAPAALDQAVNERVVERSDHHVHRLGKQRVREGAQLPVAEVRSGEEHAAAGLLGGLEVLAAFETNPARQVFFADRWQFSEHHQQPADAAEDAVDYGL